MPLGFVNYGHVHEAYCILPVLIFYVRCTWKVANLVEQLVAAQGQLVHRIAHMNEREEPWLSVP